MRYIASLKMIQINLEGGVVTNSKCTLEESQENSSKSKDYFAELPVELQLQIFSYFTPTELSKAIAPVCRKWWILSKDATLWRDLNFTITSQKSCIIYSEILLRCHLLSSLKVKSCVPLDTLIQCSVSLSVLKDLDLGFCKGLNASGFQTLVTNCPLIENLNLEGCHPGVEYNGICHIVSSLPNLRLLNLSHCISVDDMCIKTIARKCQKLELLNIDGITRITDAAVCELAEHRRDTLFHLYLDGEELTDRSMLALSGCQKLFTLKVSFGELFTDETLKALSSLPYLTWFKLRRSPNLSTEALEQFFKNSRLLFLKDLEIDSLSIDDRGLQNLARTCKNLRSLSLPWCWEISDVGLKAVIENCNMLCWLDLLGLYQLTGESLIHIPVKLPDLMYLNLEQCNNIIDTIVRDLARKMPHLKVYSYYGDQVMPSDSDEEDALAPYLANKTEGL